MLKQIINQDSPSDAQKKVSAPPKPSGGKPSQPASSPAPAPKSSSGGKIGSTKNILSSDVEIKGKLKFTSDLIIDGRIEGEVASQGDLTIGENAQIKGDIKTRSVTVFGRVEGNITVSDRCELKQNAELLGDVTAGKLAIEEGASFMGSSTVGAAAARAKASDGSAQSSPSSQGGSSSNDGGGSGGQHQQGEKKHGQG